MRKAYLLLPAILALAAANLNLSCRVELAGEPLEGLYAPGVVTACEQTALTAAEEILSGPATPPAIRRRYVLGFRKPDGDERLLTDRLLRSITGIRLRDGVFVNGSKLGTVPDGTRLMMLLRSAISAGMPASAVSGSLSGRVQIRKLYTRANTDSSDEELILRITELAPVVYVDGQGKVV